MMKKTAIFVITIILLLAFSALSAISFDGNDYDGGGGGDWGGGGDDWGDGGGGGSLSNTILGVFVVGIIAFLVIRSSEKKGKQTGAVVPSSRQGLHIQLPDRTAEIEGIIKAHDPNFSASDFVSFVKRVYIDIQTAWCKRDMSPVRVFLHDNLYDATCRQVQAKIDQGVVYHYESMVVNTAYPTSYAQDKQYEYLTVYLNARMIDWQEDEKTGKILRGDKSTRWDLRYKMKFMRSMGVVTKQAESNATAHNCPNCAAPFEITSSGKCAFCDSVVTTGQYSWVLSDFGTIRNDTFDEGIRTG
jgi:hypothetical protein